jgi:hypothetical protein
MRRQYHPRSRRIVIDFEEVLGVPEAQLRPADDSPPAPASAPAPAPASASEAAPPSAGSIVVVETPADSSPAPAAPALPTADATTASTASTASQGDCVLM